MFLHVYLQLIMKDCIVELEVVQYDLTLSISFIHSQLQPKEILEKKKRVYELCLAVFMPYILPID